VDGEQRRQVPAVMQVAAVALQPQVVVAAEAAPHRQPDR
jgi:hypothetical protein